MTVARSSPRPGDNRWVASNKDAYETNFLEPVALIKADWGEYESRFIDVNAR